GALLRAAARHLRRAARAPRGAQRRSPDPRVLPPQPAAPRAHGGAGRTGDELMAMKPEDVLRVIQAARGNAICIPTMTTGPAWRDIAPDDLSAGCVGFLRGASSLGLGLARARPERRVIGRRGDRWLLLPRCRRPTLGRARAPHRLRPAAK